jgi:hypothetical protein
VLGEPVEEISSTEGSKLIERIIFGWRKLDRLLGQGKQRG